MVSNKVDIWNIALDRVGETDAIESETEDRLAAAVCRRHWDNILKTTLEMLDWPFAIRQRGLTEISTQTVTYTCDNSRTEFNIPVSYLDNSQITVTHIWQTTETELAPTTAYTITPEENGIPAFITTVSTYGATITLRIDVALTRYGWDYLYALPADFSHAVGLLFQDVRYSLLPVDSRVRHAIMLNDAGDGHILAMNHSSTDFDKLEYVSLVTHVPAMSGHFVDAVAWRLAVELAHSVVKNVKKADYCRQMFEAAIDAASVYEQNKGYNNIDDPMTPSEAARG